MTRFFIKTIFTSTAIALLASAAHAEGTPEQRRACKKDAMTLCREFIRT